MGPEAAPLGKDGGGTVLPNGSGRSMVRWAGALVCLAACLLPATAPAGAAPRHVVSLNLCTDELLLLLAAPEQIASVTSLAHDPLESPLWRTARRYPANDGSLLSVAPLRPDLVLATGGGGRDRDAIARSLGARIVTLPYPTTLGDMIASVRTVARALGRAQDGEAVAARIAAARADAPRRTRDTIFLTGGGRTIAPDGLGAQWLALAGLRQRPIPGERVSIETLLIHPPAILLRSDYRAGQMSREADWLAQPALRRVPSRRITIEGRRWTCMGPTLLPEILRLRALVNPRKEPTR